MTWARDIEQLGKRLDRLSNTSLSGNFIPGRFHGRIVVATEKWKQIRDYRRTEVFDYLPSNWIEPHPFFGYFDNTRDQQDEALQEKINAWWKDYFALMRYIQDPDYVHAFNEFIAKEHAAEAQEEGE